MAKKETQKKLAQSKCITKSVLDILNDPTKSESECLKAAKKYFPWIGELVRKCQALSVIKDEKQWMIKFKSILELAASNVSKGIPHKPNEANVYPEKTDTALEKLITMLNNINSTSKKGYANFDQDLAPVVERYARVMMSLPMESKLRENKFYSFLCSLSHHSNAILFGKKRCDEFVKICFPHIAMKPASEVSSEDEDEESSDEKVKQSVSKSEDFISASENDEEPEEKSQGTSKRQLKSQQVRENKRTRFDSTSSQMKARKFPNGPIVLLEEATTNDPAKSTAVGGSFAEINQDIIVAEETNEMDSKSDDRPHKKSAKSLRQPLGASSSNNEKTHSRTLSMKSQRVSDPVSLGVRRMRFDDEDSLEELLTNRKKKSNKTRSITPVPVKEGANEGPVKEDATEVPVREDATEVPVIKKKPKNKVKLCSKILVQVEVHAPKESPDAVSTLSNAAASPSREVSPAPNKPPTLDNPETPIKKSQQHSPTLDVASIREVIPLIPVTASSLKSDTRLLELNQSVTIMRSNSLSESAMKRLSELKKDMRERFRERHHPDIFRITPTEKFIFKHLRVALRSKRRHNFLSWKIARSSSGKTGPKRMSISTKGSSAAYEKSIGTSETLNPIAKSSSAIKLEDLTAQASTSAFQQSLPKDSKLEMAPSTEAPKGSLNAVSVAVREKKGITRATAVVDSPCSFSAPPAFSTPTSAAPVYNGDSSSGSSSTTICYANSSFKNASPNTAPFLFNEDSGIIAGDARKSLPNRTTNAHLKDEVQENLLGCSEPSESDSELMEEISAKIQRYEESSDSEDLICADPTQPLSDALMGNFPDSVLSGPSSSNGRVEMREDKPDVTSSTDDLTVTRKPTTENQSEIAAVATEQATIRRVSSRRAGISPLPICDDIDKFLYKNGSKFLTQTLNEQQVETNNPLHQDAPLPDTPKSAKVKTNQSTLDGFLKLKAPSNLKVSLHKRRTMAPDPEQCVSDASSITLDDLASNSPKPAASIKSADRSKLNTSLQQPGTSSANASNQVENKTKTHSSKSKKSQEPAGQLKAWTWEGFQKSLPPCWAEILNRHVLEHNLDGILYYEPSNVPGVGNVKCGCGTTMHNSQ